MSADLFKKSRFPLGVDRRVPRGRNPPHNAPGGAVQLSASGGSPWAVPPKNRTRGMRMRPLTPPGGGGGTQV